MKYYKEVTDAGLTYYYAKQPDYRYALSVALSPTGLINTVRFALFSESMCREIDKAEYSQAFNKAQDTFLDFLQFNQNK